MQFFVDLCGVYLLFVLVNLNLNVLMDCHGIAILRTSDIHFFEISSAETVLFDIVSSLDFSWLHSDRNEKTQVQFDHQVKETQSVKRLPTTRI